MRTVEDYEKKRLDYSVDHLSIRAIHPMFVYRRETIRKAKAKVASMPRSLEKPRESR